MRLKKEKQKRKRGGNYQAIAINATTIFREFKKTANYLLNSLLFFVFLRHFFLVMTQQQEGLIDRNRRVVRT
jgi:hypothetical protein